MAAEGQRGNDSRGIPPVPTDLERFLGALFLPTDPILIRPIETWTEEGKKRDKVVYRHIRYYQTKTLLRPTIWRAVGSRAAITKANLIFGVCPRFRCGEGFDRSWQIRTVRVLWTDLDHCTAAEALARCEAAGLPCPSVVVNSGNGAHLYWPLAEPYLIDDVGDPPAILKEWVEVGGKRKPRNYIKVDGQKAYEYRTDPKTGGDSRAKNPEFPSALSPKAEHLQQVLEGIAGAIGGDHTTDLARLLRLPCTLNRKDQRNGKEPVPCELVECDPGRRHLLVDFERFAEAGPSRVRTKEAAKVRLPTGCTLTPNRRNRLIELLNVCEVTPVGGRSEPDFAVCAHAIEHGYDKEQVWQEAQSVGKFAERGRDYFDLTWEKAEAKVRQNVYNRTCRKAGIADEPSPNGGAGQNGDSGPHPPGTWEASTPPGFDEATPEAPRNPETPGRVKIAITTEEHEVNAAAVDALVRDAAIYQCGGMLVRVVRDVSPATKGIRRAFAPRIESLPPPLLRERLTANAEWVTVQEGEEGFITRPAHPPAWCVAAVHARGDWPGIRHLEAVVDYPVLRPDGTILSRPGYDPETGLLLDAAAEFPAIPDGPTRAEAMAALGELLEVVADFPFERDGHRAAWVAALLTPLARFAFAGPTPLFLVDANVRAAGKGLLLDTISYIVTGERFPIATYTNDEDELRKRITSLVLAGDRLALFDNLEGKFGNAVLDAALTGTAWKDRVLGVNRMAEAPLYLTWYATGNNVAIAADTARRVCHIRLESPDERPEERQGFRHPNLLAWVRENRARLLRAALTILRGYFAAGRPDQGLPALGSFEGWSGLVRSAVVWVGLPDPGETRLLLQEQADVAAESMGVLLACWERLDPDRRGLTAAEVIQLLKEPPANAPDYYADLRDAVEALAGRLDARGLGNRLRSYRRRVFGGRFIDQAGLRQRAVRWAVFPAADFRRRPDKTHETHQTHAVSGPSSECGESGESFPPESVSATADAGPGVAWEGNGEAWDGHGDSWEGPDG
jgi:hypothetical protein